MLSKTYNIMVSEAELRVVGRFRAAKFVKQTIASFVVWMALSVAFIYYQIPVGAKYVALSILFILYIGYSGYLVRKVERQVRDFVKRYTDGNQENN